VTTAGSYSVTVTNADPCDGVGGSDPITVTVYTKPNASATALAINLQVTFTNNSTNATTYIWDFGDGSASLQANPTHNYAQPGNYTVRLIAENDNCADTTTLTVSVTVGIEENEKSAFNSVKLYPNPAANWFLVGMDLVENSDIQVNVFDLTGKLMVSVNEEKMMSGPQLLKINLSDLQNGLYLVQIKAEKAVVTRRLMINK
jgi:hypothetical protein